MADMDENMGSNMGDVKSKARDTINNNRRGFGIGAGVGAAAALFTTGFIIGHKRAESQSMYHKLMRHISDMK